MYNAIFVGWGTPVHGREQQASKVFNEWVEMLGGWQSKGTIKSFTPVFLQARGGGLNGFFLITGDTKKLGDLMTTEEVRRATTRAQLIVNDFGVIFGMTGEEIGKQMTMWQGYANELK